MVNDEFSGEQHPGAPQLAGLQGAGETIVEMNSPVSAEGSARGVSCLRRLACSHMLAPVAESAPRTAGLGIVCGGFPRAVADHAQSTEAFPAASLR